MGWSESYHVHPWFFFLDWVLQRVSLFLPTPTPKLFLTLRTEFNFFFFRVCLFSWISFPFSIEFLCSFINFLIKKFFWSMCSYLLSESLSLKPHAHDWHVITDSEEMDHSLVMACSFLQSQPRLCWSGLVQESTSLHSALSDRVQNIKNSANSMLFLRTRHLRDVHKDIWPLPSLVSYCSTGVDIVPLKKNNKKKHLLLRKNVMWRIKPP